MSDLERDLAALLNPKPRGNGRLKPLSGRGPLPGRIGIGRPTVTETAMAGIASPLTEVAGTRTYHPTQTLTSSDGYTTWEVEPTKEISLVDGAGNPVALVLANTL